MSETLFSRWRRLVRAQDFVWLLLFAALAFTIPADVRDIYTIAPLAALAVVQVLEPRVPALNSAGARISWIVLKLVLGYLLIGFTHAIDSRYWLILLFPVVTAAAVLGVVGTLIFTLLAGGSYLSFLLFFSYDVTLADWNLLALRLIFLAMVGIQASVLGADLREQSRKSRRAAEQLAQANAQVQVAEEAVRRSERLAALGQLSAGLAHELRNPLGTIKASAEMLSRMLSAENDVAREVAGFITSEVDRTNSLVTRFLQFARPLEIRPEKADLSHTLDRAIAMVEREASGVAIYKNYALEIPPFPFDAELMERVFYNLALNAAQATTPGGEVTVKTRAAGRMAEVAVIDRGAGIDSKQVNSIFNPFFTTKPQGVGLGLAIVSKIVDGHGGKITVESEPGKGSIFRVLLPMEPTAAGPPPSATRP